MNFAQYIDHTQLRPDATQCEIEQLVSEAKQYGFKTVCVNASWVKMVAKSLNGTGVGITTVVGFPLGATSTASKVAETRRAIKDGAAEIDMVLNIGRFKSGDLAFVLADMIAVRKACRRKILKMIIETALLSADEIRQATNLVLDAGADFVKTSTGFASRGASFDDITIMKSVVGNQIGIKAAGGVKTINDMKKMMELGATRIGTSRGVAIITAQSSSDGY